jgi:hypothetical protein
MVGLAAESSEDGMERFLQIAGIAIVFAIAIFALVAYLMSKWKRAGAAQSDTTPAR